MPQIAPRTQPKLPKLPKRSTPKSRAEATIIDSTSLESIQAIYPSVKPKRGPTSPRTDEMIADALYEQRFPSAAARALGFSPSAISLRIAASPYLQSVMDDIRIPIVDKAEANLWGALQKGDTVATLFTLKTLGKSRGYVERTEHSVKVDVAFGPSNPPIPQDLASWNALRDSELQRIAQDAQYVELSRIDRNATAVQAGQGESGDGWGDGGR